LSKYVPSFSLIECNAVGKKKVALSLGEHRSTKISVAEVSGTYDIDHLGYEPLRDWDLKIRGVDGICEAEKTKGKECSEIDTGKDSKICTPVRNHT
jgi:hypothetical protein